MIKSLRLALMALALTTLSGAAHAVCPTFTTLTNGSPADATKVMDNYNYILGCPYFTGNVGIGTDTGFFGLDVELAAGNTSAKFGNNKPIYAIFDSPILGFNLYYESGWKYGKGSSSSYGGAIGFAPSTGKIDFYTTNSSGNASSFGSVTSRMTLTQSGSLGIGTASPGQKLDVVGTIRQSNCTTAGTLSTNASGDIICTSDARLKNVLGDYDNGLDAVTRLTPRRFTYKPTKNNPVETFVHAGFIAQEVRAVIPQAVAVQRNGYLSLDTTAILAASVNAIKELKAANYRQAGELARLRAQNAALSSQITHQTAAMRQVSDRLEAVERRIGVRTALAATRH
ncbi:MAG: tail fiber domain-containing protein [Rhizobiales bacterium]|nr:tail fiber domain-containing protein [Hyphomicrobiales bacterium]